MKRNDSPATLRDLSAAAHVTLAANDFGSKLLCHVVAGQSDNIIISPLSVWSLLAMARNGAVGDTRSAIDRTIGVATMPEGEINARWAAMARVIRSQQGSCEVEIANAAWLNAVATINPEFVKLIREFHQAEVQSLDFARDPRDAAAKMNRWADEKTHGAIKEIADTVDPTATLLLSNAVYFEGKWAFPFDSKTTALGPFYLSEARSVDVPMMRRTGNYSYLESRQFQAIRLPYVDSEFEMCVLLPRIRDYPRSAATMLAELIEAMDDGVFQGWMRNRNSPRLRGTLLFPRCDLNYRRAINPDLAQMGMRLAFDREVADFSRISPPPATFSLDQVIHQTILKIDEFGTVASAYTGMTLGLTPEDQFRMIVDHPYLCIIRERSNGAILFIAAVLNPVAG